MLSLVLLSVVSLVSAEDEIQMGLLVKKATNVPEGALVELVNPVTDVEVEESNPVKRMAPHHLAPAIHGPYRYGYVSLNTF